jgi:hypothetical protein
VLSWVLVLPRLLGIRRYALTLPGVLGVAALLALGPVVRWWLTAALAWLWLVNPRSGSLPVARPGLISRSLDRVVASRATAQVRALRL